MNRIYKVIWNEALSCFTAVGEYAKGRGKSSKSSVSANATINTTSNLSSTQFFRLSTIAIGMLAAGFTMSPQAFAQVNVGGGTGSGTAISSCNTNSTEANAEGSYSVAIGCEADAGQNFNLVDRGNPSFTWTGGSQNNSGSTAIGTGTEAGDVATALGTQAKAIGRSSVAIGAAAYSNGNTSLALGRQSAATADFAQAIGNVSSATGQGSLAVGHSALASGKRGIAIGSTDFENAGTVADQANVGYRANGQTQAVGNDTIAFGSNAKATADNSLAFGVGSRSNAVNGIALGSNSIANRAGGASGFVPVGADSSVIQATDSVTLGAVSVGTGAAGGNRQIVNVAAGSSDSDAVNVAQLTGLSNTVANNKTKYYSVDSAAVGNANNDGATGYNAMALGGNAKATGSQTIAIGSSEFGQQTMASGEQSIAIGANVVSRGASSIAIGGDDLNFASKTNIDGSPLSPLNNGTVNDVFKSYVGKDLVETNQYDVNTEAGGAASIAIGAKSLSKGDLSTAIGVHSNTSGTASSAFGVGASASKDGSVSLGAGSTTATSASSEKTMTVGGVVYDIAGNVIDDKGMLREGAQVSVGVVGSERQIKNVAGGAVTAASTDAVNGSQLYATNEAVGNNTTTINKGFALKAADGNTVQKPLGQAVEVVGSNSNIDTRVKNGKIEVELNDNLNLGTTGSVSTGNLLNGTTVNGLGIVTGGVLTGVTTVSGAGVTVTGGSIFNPTNATLTSNGLTILNGPSITKSGVNAGNKRVINVDDGVNAKDAVNFSQLETTNTNVTSNTNNISTNTTNIGTNTDNIAKGIKFNVNDASSGGTLKKTFALGEEIKFDTDSNLTTTGLSTSDGIKLGLANNLTGLNSASFNSGVSISSTGINAGDKVISGVASGGTTETNAANIGDVQMAAAEARTKVVKGTNVASVDFSTDSDTGQDVYTVNANGTSVSTADANALTVSTSVKDPDTNITDYQVDLSEGSKASLVKADSAMQTVVTQINGADVKTLDKDNNTANFITGDNIVLTADNGGIKIATAADLVSTSLTTGTTVVNADGVTFTGGTNQTVRLSNSGLDNGGNQITNVANGTIASDAVNFGQLQATTTTIDKGFDFDGDTGTTVNRQLGDKLTVKGGATVASDLSNGNNIGVVADGTSTLTVKLAKDLTGLNSANFGSGVSISANGLNNGGNKITNVAEATTGKDAVNFDQLSATNSLVAKGIKIGDGNSANDQQFALGDTINVTGDSNITTTASATGVQVKLNNQLNLGNEGSMQIGNSIMNSNGFTFTDNGPGRTVRLSSSGLDNGFNRITNVAAGIADTDAATVGQLNATTFALDQGWGLTAQGDVATMIKQGSAIDLNSTDGNIKVSRSADNNVSAGLRAAAPLAGVNDISFDLNPDLNLDSVTTGDTIMNNNGLTITGGPSVTKAGINAADTKITNVVNGDVSEGSKDAINGGQLYAQGSGISSIIGGETVYNPVDGTFTNSNIGGTGQNSIDGAIASIKQGEIVINENIQANTTNIQTNTTNIATNKTNIDTNTTNIKVNKDKIDAGLNFGADSGATINKPVGDGSVLTFTGGNNITTTAAGSSIKFDLNGNINIDSVKTGNTTINNNGVSIVGGPSMTASGINAAGNKITDVADGMAPRDAVNMGQLDAVSQRLGNNMNELGYKIGEVEDDANAGISAAMAMSSLPQAYIAGKSLIGGGIGTYNGESAVAIGFSKLSNDGRWVMKVNGTADTQGNAGGSIGAGFHFD
ncbi:YadA-like family protein [Psychrobacter sp. Ps7]|uniref:YadA-like family protein n=1 Tax=Psychrobacter sp. Ps7 TaxID=2790961 RepID=UPI001EE0FB4D|nr:YadA-like family protein [Psychrobacter sp. Ps7]MCG3872104.1 YadA-like family protein [Psychrobacter sp. Ps7]